MKMIEKPPEGQMVRAADVRFEYEIFGGSYEPRYYEQSTMHARAVFFRDSMGDLAAYPIADLPQ